MIFSRRGQTTIGIVAVVAVISFILMMNLQSQAEIVQRKIIATKAQSEAESAINDFARQLYSAYVQAAVIKESMDGNLRFKPPNIINGTFEFYISSGRKLCTSRARNGTDVSICITLPDDFAQIQKNYFLDPNYETRQQSFFVRLAIKIFFVENAQAQRVQTASFAPNPNAVFPALAVDRSTASPITAEPYFVEQYEQLNCEGANPRLGCVKIKICLKFSGCTKEEEKVRQTYVFLRVPNTQLRN